MTIRTTKIHGLEVWQVVRNGQVVAQFMSKQGLITWVWSQK